MVLAWREGSGLSSFEVRQQYLQRMTEPEASDLPDVSDATEPGISQSGKRKAGRLCARPTFRLGRCC